VCSAEIRYGYIFVKELYPLSPIATQSLRGEGHGKGEKRGTRSFPLTSILSRQGRGRSRYRVFTGEKEGDFLFFLCGCF
jgi:hypothetical protein